MPQQQNDDYEPCAAPEKGVWSKEEHARFLEAIQMYPKGPWRAITEHVGTRSVRQVQTHAQKYQEKVARRERGLQKNRQKVVRTEHRVDEATFEFVNRPRAAKGRRRASAAPTTPENELTTTPEPQQFIAAPPPPPPAPPVAHVSTYHQPQQHSRPPRIEVVFEKPRPSSGPIDADSLDIRGMMISCTSDEVIREAADLLDLSPSPSLTEDPHRQSVPSYTQPEQKKQKLNKMREIPTIDESLDFFIKIMSIWGSTARRP